MRCHLVTVNTVYNLSYRLSLKIRSSSYQPGVIVAISRGGFVPARFLCDFLNVSDMLSIKVRHYEAGATKLASAFVKYPLPSQADLRSSNVLIVDDVNDTGESLHAAVEHVSTFQPKDLKTAVLHEKETTQCNADYYGVAVRHWRWIIYPWAALEDVGSFIRRMDPQPTSLDETAARLKQDYGIRIGLGWLRKIVDFVPSDREV